MSLTLLPAEWQRWLLYKLDHGSKPAELLRDLTQQGRLSLRSAMQAIDEVRSARQQGRLPAASAVALPEIDVQRCGPPVSLRIALDAPRIRMLDGVLDPGDCAWLRGLAGANLHWQASAPGNSLPAGADQALQRLLGRLACLADRPQSHFEPLEIRRWQAGDLPPPDDDSQGQALPSAGGATQDAGRRLGCFMVTLGAPQRGGGLCFPGAAGFCALPHAGGAVWVQHLRADGWPDASAHGLQQPVQAGVLWLATLWLRERPWPAPSQAVPVAAP